MEGRLVSVHDEGGTDRIVKVFWLYDDHRLAKLVVMKLDRPVGQEFDDRCGNTVALLRPQRFVGTCGTVAQVIFGISYQHRPVPPWLPITPPNRLQHWLHGGFLFVSSRFRTENIERNGIAATVFATRSGRRLG